MVSGSSRLASQANSSTKVSPWKVRGLGICLASGGSMLMSAQSSNGPPAGSDTCGQNLGWLVNHIGSPGAFLAFGVGAEILAVVVLSSHSGAAGGWGRGAADR